jgi:hypothetical protein
LPLVSEATSQKVESLTDDTIAIAKSLTKDESVSHGYRKEVQLSGVPKDSPLRDITIQGLSGYGISDMTVFTDKGGNALYLFNSSDVSRLRPENRALRSGGLISAEGSSELPLQSGDGRTRKFVVFLSAADQKRLSMGSDIIAGTFKQVVRSLSDQEKTIVQRICKDEAITRGYFEDVDIIGGLPKKQREFVITILRGYGVAQSTTLTDATGVTLHHFDGTDLSRYERRVYQCNNV